MYSIRDDVDLSKMRRIGILTVDSRNLYKDVRSYMVNASGTPTEFFFNKLKACTYKAGENPILSVRDDSGLVVAKFDSDAIFLYSENEVMVPTEFIHMWLSLFEGIQNTSIDLDRNIYASFGLDNLNMNFVNMALTTGMTPEVMKEYLENFERMKDRKTTYTAKEDGISATYHGKDGVIGFQYSSQSGMSAGRFLDAMINMSPDIRLLMSNTILTPSQITLKNVLVETVRKSNRQYYNWTDREIAGLIECKISSGKPTEDEKEQKFYEIFSEESARNRKRIKYSNEKYKLFPALKHVLGLTKKDAEEGDTQEDVATRFMLEWYDGDPDNGIQALNYALSLISRQMSTECPINNPTARNLPEVRDYMAVLAERTKKLNQRIKHREQQAKIHY